MNIGIDIRPLMNANRTGVGEYTFELLNNLFKIDQQNQYFLYYNSFKDVSAQLPQWNQPNVHYTKTNWPNKIFNLIIYLTKYPKLDNLILKKNNLNKLDFFISTNIHFTAVSKQTKFIQTIHDLTFKIYPHFYSLKRKLWHFFVNPKKLCQQADIVIAPSACTKNDLEKYYGLDEAKIKIFYPGLATNMNKTENYTTEHRKIKDKYNLPDNFILFLGTIEPRKNISGLIEAFEKLIQSGVGNQYLIIAGLNGWKNRSIYKQAKRSPYHNFIRFIGYVDKTDKPVLYSLASIFIYPSFYEGFGLPVLEAMACNTPAITSNRSSLPEIYGKSAWLINPNKSTEITKAITRLLNSDKEREFLIKQGQKTVEKYNWHNSASKLKTILDEL